MTAYRRKRRRRLNPRFVTLCLALLLILIGGVAAVRHLLPQRVEAGDVIATVYARTLEEALMGADLVNDCIEMSDTPVDAAPFIRGIVS